MKWESYKKKFSLHAKKDDFTKNEIASCLNYAKKLFDQNLPIIYDQKHLSFLIGYGLPFLMTISNSQKYFYRTFSIPKKNGNKRKISEPLPSLKEIQKWILEHILYECKVSNYSKAYVPKRSIKDNARFHKKQKYLLTVDIKNFFGSTTFGQVLPFFITLGYSKSVSVLLSNLCTLNESLPQGAPTSPALSNLLNLKLDSRFSGYTHRRKIRYTRYADDMAFSGDFNVGELLSFVKMVIADAGYAINNKKTHLMKSNCRQKVTGIVVNEKMQVPREVRRKVRQHLYYIEKYGFASHLEHAHIVKANYINHILGIANFILFVNPSDVQAKEHVEKLKKYLPLH